MAFWTEDNTANSALVRVVIANNTFYDIFDAGLQINRPTADHDARIHNNIIHCRNDMIVCHTWPGIEFKNNCWSKTPPSQASSSGDLIGDPQITASGSTAAGALTAEYFKLTQSSPRIGKATVLTEVPEDFFGDKRDNSPDIGVHEYMRTTAARSHAPLLVTAQGSAFQIPLLLNGRVSATSSVRRGIRQASNIVILRNSLHLANPIIMTAW